MEDDNCELNEENFERIQRVSAFRRILPQVNQTTYKFNGRLHWSFAFKCLGTLARNLICLNVGEFFGFLAILIPALSGLNKEANPDETLEITANQVSWLRKSNDSIQLFRSIEIIVWNIINLIICSHHCECNESNWLSIRRPTQRYDWATK